MANTRGKKQATKKPAATPSTPNPIPKPQPRPRLKKSLASTTIEGTSSSATNPTPKPQPRPRLKKSLASATIEGTSSQLPNANAALSSAQDLDSLSPDALQPLAANTGATSTVSPTSSSTPAAGSTYSEKENAAVLAKLANALGDLNYFV